MFFFFLARLKVNFFLRLRQQCVTFALTALLVYGSVVVCEVIRSRFGPSGAAAWISLTNISVPIALREVCLMFEDHVSLNDQQISLFLKLSIFRWLNTAIVLYLITNFEDTLTAAAMKQVKAVLLADAITTPLLRTINPYDTFMQLFVSKFSKTQEKMNTYFFGAPW
jgi:hypothetical protein